MWHLLKELLMTAFGRQGLYGTVWTDEDIMRLKGMFQSLCSQTLKNFQKLCHQITNILLLILEMIMQTTDRFSFCIKIVIGNLSWWKLQHYVAFIAATEKEQSRKHWKFLGTVSSERTIRYMGKRMRTAIRPVPYEPDPFFLTGETMSFLQELLE